MKNRKKALQTQRTSGLRATTQRTTLNGLHTLAPLVEPFQGSRFFYCPRYPGVARVAHLVSEAVRWGHDGGRLGDQPCRGKTIFPNEPTGSRSRNEPRGNVNRCRHRTYVTRPLISNPLGPRCALPNEPKTHRPSAGFGR